MGLRSLTLSLGRVTGDLGLSLLRRHAGTFQELTVELLLGHLPVRHWQSALRATGPTPQLRSLLVDGHLFTSLLAALLPAGALLTDLWLRGGFQAGAAAALAPPALPRLPSLTLQVDQCLRRGTWPAELANLLRGRTLTSMRVDVGAGACRTRRLVPALASMASMPSTLRLGRFDANCDEAALCDRCLQVLPAGPSAADTVRVLHVELSAAVTGAGLRALGRLAALRHLSLTAGDVPAAAAHPWAVPQLADLTVSCGSTLGAAVITSLAAAAMPRLSSLTLRSSVPLPRLVAPAVAALRVRRFCLCWCRPRGEEAAGAADSPADPVWLAVHEWVRPLRGGGVATFR